MSGGLMSGGRMSGGRMSGGRLSVGLMSGGLMSAHHTGAPYCTYSVTFSKQTPIWQTAENRRCRI